MGRNRGVCVTVPTCDGGQNGCCPRVSACRRCVTGDGGCCVSLQAVTSVPPPVCANPGLWQCPNPLLGGAKGLWGCPGCATSRRGALKGWEGAGGCWHCAPLTHCPLTLQEAVLDRWGQHQRGQHGRQQPHAPLHQPEGTCWYGPLRVPRGPPPCFAVLQSLESPLWLLGGWQLSCAGSP